MPNESSPQLLIVGASVRAAAQSAVRAGYKVWGADLFADADLCDIASAHHVTRYPAGLMMQLSQAPQVPWIYTGALENYPSLLDRMAKLRTCWGNSAEVVRRVRDPLLLQETLPQFNVAFPKTLQMSDQQRFDSNLWLSKPKRSGGGSKIDWLDEKHAPRLTSRRFVQKFVPGKPCSAVYVAAGGRAILLGLTRQLLGSDWLGAEGFTYCGSVGPLMLAEKQRAELQQIGDVLAAQFHLVGLFGVDLVQRAKESLATGEREFVVIEVNPRYTASVEILERSLDFAALNWHAQAFERGELPASDELPPAPTDRCLAKGILFAKRHATFHPKVASYVRERNIDLFTPAIADIPPANTPLAAGSPVVTLFASGSNPAEAERELCQKVCEMEKILYQP